MTRDGIVIVDKPCGWSSHDVVNKMRRIAGTRRVGHLGTLDPIATGVLPVMIGQATRLAQFYGRADKVYEAVIRFGYSTDTYDRAGVPTSEETQPAFDRERIETALRRFGGKLSQIPPPVSAKKVAGVRAYELARKNIAMQLAPVDVEVFGIELTGFADGRASVSVHCSTGTYVRAIAHELGKIVGTGAYLDSLRRTRSGEFGIDRACTVERLDELSRDGRLGEAVIPAAELLAQFPSIHVEATVAGQIRQGRDFHASPFLVRGESQFVKAISESGELVAIGQAKLPHVYHPVVVFN